MTSGVDGWKVPTSHLVTRQKRRKQTLWEAKRGNQRGSDGGSHLGGSSSGSNDR